MITYFDSIFFVILISLKIKKIHKEDSDPAPTRLSSRCRFLSIMIAI